MTRFELIRKEFSGLKGPINFAIGDIDFSHIDVDADNIFGWDMVLQECGCCYSSEWFEGSLSFWVSDMNMYDYDSFISHLSEIKNNS
jgi:hypothetical protein